MIGPALSAQCPVGACHRRHATFGEHAEWALRARENRLARQKPPPAATSRCCPGHSARICPHRCAVA